MFHDRRTKPDGHDKRRMKSDSYAHIQPSYQTEWNQTFHFIQTSDLETVQRNSVCLPDDLRLNSKKLSSFTKQLGVVRFHTSLRLYTMGHKTVPFREEQAA